LLTAVGLTPGGSSTVHIYTQNDTFNLGRVLAVPRLCELHPGVCLTTEEKAQKNPSQGSRRVPAGTMKTEYTEQNIRNNKNVHKHNNKHTVLTKLNKRINIHKRKIQKHSKYMYTYYQNPHIRGLEI